MPVYLKKAASSLVAIIGMICTTATASDSSSTGWKKSLVIDLTATQTAYSDSWEGGEAGAASWVGNLNGKAEKQISPKFDFATTLKLSFGQTLIQDTAKNWSKPRKSTDLIDWENVGLLTLDSYVDPFVAFRLESQFLDASIESKKRYLSPLKLTESAGIARVFYEKEDDKIFSRLGLAFRQIMKDVVLDSLTLTTEDSTLTDSGIESVTDVSLSLGERLAYTGKLTLYKALFFSEKDKVKGTEYENYWKAIDVNWENIVNASISDVIKVNFYTQILYDKEVSKKGRFKETLGIGFVFKIV
jgi:hypothetical protein